ncbi:11166_t:CDS:10 [Funneliformis geosporum]|uniref:16084_t:CDS:1 n=1 Tax=Funneliformis geosporum TaxID=1117311 RepID=A0A9W4WIH7_9GLOM|nr:16084_t:CDS:10 [Funneliformis geosporum]CAI2167009.1 11166_t:CDS:10 [Funneliformis geosporum]
MGKRDKKTGKGRLDKYYHLAKEQGYRARSAFKLIQLNKKYNFLEKSKCLIDLCAAPGGWLQVASKYMPVSSLIIDITTDKCRAILRNELKTWKADVVLHDGAPNVGVSWIQDAYAQSELTLKALKLAVESLNKGGTFVTKVFRSKDYNNLLWVFNQLFKKVEATKPASSRNVSAEIFVVCRDFLAPKKIDPKFLDPRSVFQEVDIGPTNRSVDILHPEKKKRQREGYDDGDYTLFKEASVLDFIQSNDPIKLLSEVNKLNFDTDEAKKLLNHEMTIEEIKMCCEDLKVLGKREFKNLLKWRNSIRSSLQEQDEINEKTIDKEEKEESVDEDEIIQEELERLTKEEQARQKKFRRKANEKRQKNVTRMQLKMISPTDIALDQVDLNGSESLFNLKQIDKSGMLKTFRKGDMNIVIENEQDDGDIVIDDIDVQKKQNDDTEEMEYIDDENNLSYLEQEMEDLYEQYKEHKAERDAKYRVKKMREENEEWNGNQTLDKEDDCDSDTLDYAMPRNTNTYDSSSSSEDDSEVESFNSNKVKNKAKKKNKNLLTDLNDDEDEERSQSPSGLSKKATLFFDHPLFKKVMEEYDENKEHDQSSLAKKIQNDENNDLNLTTEEYKLVESSRSEPERDESQVNKNKSLKRKVEAIEEDDDLEIVPVDKDSDEELWNANESDDDDKKMKRTREIGLLTAEAVTLAQQLVNRQKTKEDLIDEGFRRHTFNDRKGLPSWFLDDEMKHNKVNLPITKEAVEIIRQRMKALNARPIKKIAEAKARKKMRAIKRLAKLQNKTDVIVETPSMTEKEKAQTISKMIAKTQKKVKKEVKVVVAKGGAKGMKGRPKGVKGRYKPSSSHTSQILRKLNNTFFPLYIKIMENVQAIGKVNIQENDVMEEASTSHVDNTAPPNAASSTLQQIQKVENSLGNQRVEPQVQQVHGTNTSNNEGSTTVMTFHQQQNLPVQNVQTTWLDPSLENKTNLSNSTITTVTTHKEPVMNEPLENLPTNVSSTPPSTTHDINMMTPNMKSLNSTGPYTPDSTNFPSPSTPLDSSPSGTFNQFSVNSVNPDKTISGQQNNPNVVKAKPFVCTVCNQTFSRQHNLKSHALTHSQEKPFQCDICHHFFRRHHDLKRHAKLHTGEKPYQCPHCKRKFARLDALNRHLRAENLQKKQAQIQTNNNTPINKNEISFQRQQVMHQEQFHSWPPQVSSQQLSQIQTIPQSNNTQSLQGNQATHANIVMTNQSHQIVFPVEAATTAAASHYKIQYTLNKQIQEPQRRVSEIIMANDQDVEVHSNNGKTSCRETQLIERNSYLEERVRELENEVINERKLRTRREYLEQRVNELEIEKNLLKQLLLERDTSSSDISHLEKKRKTASPNDSSNLQKD